MSSFGRVRNPLVRVRAGAGAVLIALAAAITLSGCGNDGSTEPTGDEIETPPRSTPQELMDYFENAYTQQDSVLYAAMLDEEFRFYFLQVDADSLREILGPEGFWGRTLDLESSGALFTHPKVTGITLSILITSTMESGNEDCLECQQLETSITLRVVTVRDDEGTLTYTVDSPQTFYVRPDPSDSTALVIWRQIDRPGALKVEGSTAPSVESQSWGGIKGLYR